jgi:Nucleotidyl transferase AbiEii toxin, Type IV TA system
MTLDQHPDFRDLIAITSDELCMTAELIEKDYWVTRVLRALARDSSLQQQIIFKGGTSLSKGWKLIDRFSEDIDLLSTGPNFSAPPGKSARATRFRKIIERVETETPLKRPIIDGLSREERDFLYLRGDWNCGVRLPLPGHEIAPGSNPVDYVFLEMGFRGGPHPVEIVALNSFVGEAILAGKAGSADRLKDYADDFRPFDFVLLHPTRTFVEKLLAVDAGFVKGIEHVRTRHYYDICSVYTRFPGIKEFIHGPEFPKLVREAIEIGNENFGSNTDPDLNLTRSPALNLKPEQIEILERQYKAEVAYYFKGQLPFGELVQTLESVRETLATTLK